MFLLLDFGLLDRFGLDGGGRGLLLLGLFLVLGRLAVSLDLGIEHICQNYATLPKFALNLEHQFSSFRLLISVKQT